MEDSTNLAPGEGSTVSVHAGFPNAAADRAGQAPLSLDRLLIKHPVSTFFFRIRGHQWEERGVFDGDIALIDRATTPHENNLVIWWDEAGQFYLSNFRKSNRQNTWGTVTAIIHPTQRAESKDE